MGMQQETLTIDKMIRDGTLIETLTGRPVNYDKARDKRIAREPLFACQECGKKFYTAASADRAAFGDHGCPKCGGSDIDIYVKN